MEEIVCCHFQDVPVPTQVTVASSSKSRIHCIERLYREFPVHYTGQNSDRHKNTLTVDGLMDDWKSSALHTV